MAFTLYSLLQAALLCVNAIAVLHEERFLKNSEWGCGRVEAAAAVGSRGRGPQPAACEGTLGRDGRAAEGSALGALPWGVAEPLSSRRV